MSSTDVVVETLKEFNSTDAEAIHKLLPSLDKKFVGTPINGSLLKEIIDSPYHEQIVAKMNGQIVGVATLSTTLGIAAGRKIYLEDFVVDENMQGHGIGNVIWSKITEYCKEKDAMLHFTSRPAREAAQKFYLKHGATVYDTTVFHWKD